MRPDPGQAAYRLDRLGWLQFERLASLVLAAEAGVIGVRWQERSAGGRAAWVEDSVTLAHADISLPEPVAVIVAWVGAARSPASQIAELLTALRRFAASLELRPADRLLIVTNLAGHLARQAASAVAGAAAHVVVLGPAELGQAVDRHAGLRAAMPSLLGLRDLDPLIPAELAARSSLDIERARALARVFVPTRAYGCTRAVLARHRFVVLTGPPEMGKTAIAQMIALAQLTDGWEAHDCISPEQVWSAFDADRAQVFVADDAFGSTEYRADAAARWASELGRLLGALDDRHWLIWTSRPAPLRAGLRRVQRERGAERFPAPGEVLVDASDLDLEEKTTILFRHVKARGVNAAVRDLVRATGLTIVEHPHFTPERIRRFADRPLDHLVAARLGPLRGDPRLAGAVDEGRRALVRAAVERELATPTQEMATSFRALEDEHRALLTALLDTPAGLTDARELAATMRRHHPAGLSHPPGELIDRLTDHFLRISSLGIDWVHPSWRDLVIDELRADPDRRRRFLRACGPYGALLVLSRDGGPTGTRVLPLLVDDTDWDAFTDRIGGLLRELEDADVARLLLAAQEALGADLDPPRRAEARSFVAYVLGATRRSWDARHRALPVFLLAAWYEANHSLPTPVDPPRVDRTWVELHPGLLAAPVAFAELQRADDWLTLAQILAARDPETLERLGFPARDEATLRRLSEAVAATAGGPDHAIAAQVAARLERVAPGHAAPRRAPSPAPAENRWWVPEDIEARPTTELVNPAAATFTRADVDRVLRDL